MITHHMGLQQEQRREGAVLGRAQSQTNDKDASDLQLSIPYSDWIVHFEKLPYSDPTAREWGVETQRYMCIYSNQVEF